MKRSHRDPSKGSSETIRAGGANKLSRCPCKDLVWQGQPGGLPIVSSVVPLCWFFFFFFFWGGGEGGSFQDPEHKTD